MADPVARKSALAPGEMPRVVVDGVPVLLCNVDGNSTRSKTCARTTAARSTAANSTAAGSCARGTARSSTSPPDKALTLPAVSPLPTYPVEVEGDDVFVDVS